MIRPKHLFDQAEALFESFALSPEDVLLKQVKSHCLLEDCVLAIEQDLRPLIQIVEDKMAIDAELANLSKNERSENCFVIEGMPLISPPRLWARSGRI